MFPFQRNAVLVAKRRQGQRLVRVYGPAQTPYARVMLAGEVTPANKAELAALHRRLNPFQLAREVEQQKKQIEARRLAPSPRTK
jgi:hypothetical protein